MKRPSPFFFAQAVAAAVVARIVAAMVAIDLSPEAGRVGGGRRRRR